MATLLHSADLGDVISSLPILRELGGGRLVIGPMLRGQGRESLKGKRFDSLCPLLAQQPYIESISWQDEPTDFTHDLRSFRREERYGESLLDWQARFLNVRVSSAPWLQVMRHPVSLGRAVVARSARYHNGHFPWPEVLKQHPKPLFVGTEAEFNAFQLAVGRADYQPTANLLELAEVIAGADIFIGNQSCPFWIACGLGVRLIQETWAHSPNSVVLRPNARYVRGSTLQQTATVTLPEPPSKPAPKVPERKHSPLVCVFSFCRDDKVMATQLATHIACMGGVEHHRCILLHPDNVDGNEIMEQFESVFESVHDVSYAPRLSGWPDGPNQAFYEAVTAIIRLKVKWPWLFMEPDCVSMRPQWLNAIADEYRVCGQKVLGVLNDTFDPNGRIIGKNVNGVAVYPPDFLALCPIIKNLITTTDHYRRMNEVPPAFDAYLSPYTMKMFAQSQMIQTIWRSEGFSEKGGQVMCRGNRPVSPDAALIHGCKDFSLLDIVQGRLCEEPSRT